MPEQEQVFGPFRAVRAGEGGGFFIYDATTGTVVGGIRPDGTYSLTKDGDRLVEEDRANRIDGTKVFTRGPLNEMLTWARKELRLLP